MPNISDNKMMQKSALWWLWIAAIVLVLDQWTKNIATESLQLYQAQVVNNFFNWTLMHNEGMAFSFLADQSGWQRWGISFVAIIIVIWLLFWLAKGDYKNRLLNSSLSFIIGGALGNIYDRLTLGYVVDFIEVHYNDYFWPAFNLADTAISIGALLLIIDAIWGKHEDKSG